MLAQGTVHGPPASSLMEPDYYQSFSKWGPVPGEFPGSLAFAIPAPTSVSLGQLVPVVAHIHQVAVAIHLQCHVAADQIMCATFESPSNRHDFLVRRFLANMQIAPSSENLPNSASPSLLKTLLFVKKKKVPVGGKKYVFFLPDA